jgi:hypothetical protein
MKALVVFKVYWKLSFFTSKSYPVMVSGRHFWKLYELIWLSLQFGRISDSFQYPVSGRISGKSNPLSGRIPDIKKDGLSGLLDIRCISLIIFYESCNLFLALLWLTWDCPVLSNVIVFFFSVAPSHHSTRSSRSVALSHISTKGGQITDL